MITLLQTKLQDILYIKYISLYKDIYKDTSLYEDKLKVYSYEIFNLS